MALPVRKWFRVIDRIEAYDDIGSTTELNSVVAINPEAIIDAREKDLIFAVTGIDGPLQRVLREDNFNTEQMPTSGARWRSVQPAHPRCLHGAPDARRRRHHPGQGEHG